MKPKYAYLLLCVIVSLVLISTVFTITLTTRTSEIATSSVFKCVDLDESDDALCDVGEDEEGPLPFIEDVADENEVDTMMSAQDEDDDNDNDDNIIYKGITLAGGEILNSDNVPDDNDAQIFIYKGLNTFNIPIRWENLASRNGVIRPGLYVQKLDAVITGLLQKNAAIILSLHNYMRYDAGNGTEGFIGECKASFCYIPSLTDVRNFWLNVVNRYSSARLIYNIMNEHDDSTSLDLKTEYIRTALSAIRSAETGKPHLILISFNDGNRLLNWFGFDRAGIFNDVKRNFLVRVKIFDSGNNHSVVVHQYFDRDQSGRYIDGECMSTGEFKTLFDANFPLFIQWMITNKQTVFIAEFGAPNTAACRQNIIYFLNHTQLFPFNKTLGYGILGWTIWAAGKRWDGLYPLSLSPGGIANTLIWNRLLYENYLPPLRTTSPRLIRPERRAIQITNNSPEKFIYLDGYVPFEFAGSANIEVGAVVYLYSNIGVNTPSMNLRIRYRTRDNNTLIAIGLFQISPDDTTLQLKSNLENRDHTPPRFKLVASDNNCFITAAGLNHLESEQRCYVILPV